jgi:DNA polymerase elongation subunit (family B)
MATQSPVLNCYLDDDGQHVIVVEQVDGKAKERRVRATYATFHRAGDLNDALLRDLKRSEFVRSVAKTDDGWIKIGWRDDYSRRQARYKFRDIGVDVFEGDVDPVLFWLIESKATIAKPRRCSLDFEADSRVPLSRKQDMRVLSWACTDFQTGVTTKMVLEADTEAAERRLLEALVRYLDDYDQITVWEGDWKGGEFDTFLFEARTRRCGMGVDPRRWIWLNQLAVWKKMNAHSAESGAEKESYKLEDIAFEQLGRGKVKAPAWVVEAIGDKALQSLGAVTWELWERGGEFRQLMLDYNGEDAEILVQLEQKKGYLALFQATCELCHLPPTTQALQPTRQMDGYIIPLGRAREHRFPTRPFRDAEDEEEDKGKFRGAVVFHPKSVPDEANGWTKEHAKKWREDNGFRNGILSGVHVCDFKSLYPSVMRTYNLSADAVAGWMTDKELAQKGGVPAGHCRSPGTGLVTRLDPEGYLPLALRDLMRLRQHYADEAAKLSPGTAEWQDMMAKSTACKVTANSFYGGGGSKYSRFNHRDVSEACTQNGVHFLKLTASEGEQRGMVLVYGDTDSNMVVGPTEEGFRRFVAWINGKKIPAEVASHGCRENFVELAFEKTFDRIVFVAAKAYVGRYSQYKGTPAKRECHGATFKHGEACPSCGGHGKLAGEPEIKGVAWKRGDKGKLARELQGKVIDLLVGGVKLKDESGRKVPANPGIETPTEDIAEYFKVLEATRTHVLGGELPLSEVRLSKALSKSLREYGKDASEAHVRAAKMLEDRGQHMSRGMRVEYVVVDGSKSPQAVIPAEDYAGECDRFYLWEKVYAPTKLLLEAAFPDHDWESWGDVRPKAPTKRGKAAPEGQLGLSLTERPKAPAPDYGELAVPGFSIRPLVVRVPEAAGTAAIDRVTKVLLAHPGARRVELVVALASGDEAVLGVPLLVSTSPKLKAAVERAIAGDDAA